MNEQIRADFEDEAVKFSDVIEFTRDHARGRPDCYVDFTAQCAWEFWQAAHASYAPREKELEEGWEILPSDLRTHLADFKTAVVLLTGHHTHDYKGYWTHQFQVIERIEALIATKEPQ